MTYADQAPAERVYLEESARCLGHGDRQYGSSVDPACPIRATSGVRTPPSRSRPTWSVDSNIS